MCLRILPPHLFHNGRSKNIQATSFRERFGTLFAVFYVETIKIMNVMKNLKSIILLSLITLSLSGQNLSVDKYPLNYDLNNATITNNTAIFSGGMIVNVDSTLTISFNAPVRCSQVRLFGASWIGDYRHVSMFTNSDYSDLTSASGGIGYYGMAGNGYNFYDEADADYNLTAFSFVVVDGQFTIDSIVFTIDEGIINQSQYDIGFITGYDSGYPNGVAAGIASVDTTIYYNNGVDAGIASVDTVAPYNNGVASVDSLVIYTEGLVDGMAIGVASVDTTVPYNNGVVYGLSQCVVVDSTAIYNDGFMDGVASIDNDAIWNEGHAAGVASVNTDSYFDAGVASVNTDSYFDAGYTAGVASVDTDSYFDAGVASVDTVAPYNNGYLAAYNEGLADCQATAIDETILDNINVYPNPTSDWITIDVDNYDHSEIYSVMGSLLENTTEQSVSLIDYNVGTYFLRVYTSEGEVAVIKVLRK